MTRRQDEVVEALARTLESLDAHIRKADDGVRRATRYRLSILHLHAAFAVYIGMQFATLTPEQTSGPTWILIRNVPGMPVLPASVLFIGGVILGTATWRRVLVWEMVGLSMLLLWYVLIAVSFGGALLWWQLGWLPPGTVRPAPYAHGVYAHLACMMVVHLVVLLRLQNRVTNVRLWRGISGLRR